MVNYSISLKSFNQIYDNVSINIYLELLSKPQIMFEGKA